MKNEIVKICAGGGGSYLNGCVVPVPVRVSETGRARNWTMPPLRPERECRERTNRASVENTCKGFDRRENQRCAFTMAEILLSLTIIGVVAAITLPSLTGNINERTWNTQRKALYARMSQAIALMPALNGYGTLTEDENGSVTTDTAAETFVTEGLSKVLKINNICDNEHLADCGVPNGFTDMAGSKVEKFPPSLVALNPMFNSTYLNFTTDENGSPYVNGVVKYSQTDTKAAAFETQNGESVVAYYNPYCRGSYNDMKLHFIQPEICVNFVFDLNGNKGPNTVDKDIGFITVFSPTDSVVVAPQPLMQNATTGGNLTQPEAGAACNKMTGESRLPNMYELSSMFCNRALINPAVVDTNGFWSSSRISANKGWLFNWAQGRLQPKENDFRANIRCIKR